MSNFSVTVNPEFNIIMAKHTGIWTNKSSDALVNEITRLAKSTGFQNVLIDHRTLEIDLNITILLYLWVYPIGV